ncbi:MAG: hypothetical protein M0Q15_03660 [Nevskia sp.]|nr:hypothetical protein [Nevskia sp.]
MQSIRTEQQLREALAAAATRRAKDAENQRRKAERAGDIEGVVAARKVRTNWARLASEYRKGEILPL